MSGKESIGVRVLTPSGGISAVELNFTRGRYEGVHRWTQPGMHTVSVTLDQEAVVGRLGVQQRRPRVERGPVSRYGVLVTDPGPNRTVGPVVA